MKNMNMRNEICLRRVFNKYEWISNKNFLFSTFIHAFMWRFSAWVLMVARGRIEANKKFWIMIRRQLKFFRSSFTWWSSQFHSWTRGTNGKYEPKKIWNINRTWKYMKCCSRFYFTFTPFGEIMSAGNSKSNEKL